MKNMEKFIVEIELEVSNTQSVPNSSVQDQFETVTDGNKVIKLSLLVEIPNFESEEIVHSAVKMHLDSRFKYSEPLVGVNEKTAYKLLKTVINKIDSHIRLDF